MADESDGTAVESPREDPDAITSQGEEEEDDEGFTFAPATRLPGGGAFGDGRVIGHVYPVFGRPRSPPPTQQPEEEEAGTATVRVPLRQLLLAERGSSSPSTQEPDDDADSELDGVPAETYCLWSPGTSPSASTSPAQFPKSGSTGSVLRWRQRLQVGRSHSDGKEKFVFLQEDAAGSSASPGRDGRAGGIHSWSYYGRGRGSGRGSRRSSPATFLPYKQDLVGLFANASALRRSYHPF
ncbi:uncharacterized protein LOC124706068 [Lolium rigidum]|uniref:uncharacterized protein LOC124706068 n=1 Tax=Lolium rigidum TaxID=89674 RepID=UPI001F5D65C0|nr:uncharacterized protein LOC124706068 [Lolium rigidum]